MTDYEAIIVLTPALGDDKIDALLSRFEKKIKDGGGELGSIEKWGRKRLNFIFQKHKNLKEGFFVLLNFKGVGSTVTSLRDAFRVQEEVVRHQIARATARESAPAPAEVVFPADIKPVEESSGGAQ
ncbi:30S ribosomal protein S6 [Candidatus Saganbacteria bacterium]|nr:30S ribosomal protein S6 [Candidatus Saganbacteria bacterium]